MLLFLLLGAILKLMSSFDIKMSNLANSVDIINIYTSQISLPDRLSRKLHKYLYLIHKNRLITLNDEEYLTKIPLYIKKIIFKEYYNFLVNSCYLFECNINNDNIII